MRIPAHPGKILKREIAARNMSANRLALDLGVPATRISEILRGRRGITPETALRLAAYFGGMPHPTLRQELENYIGQFVHDTDVRMGTIGKTR